jgi:prepilin-type processing-associated H-X9-DG protein
MTAHDRASHSRFAAFTLVELLVVVGIVAMLLAIILPALNRATRAARLVQCQANLKQLSNGVFMYAVENHGRRPPNTSSPSGQFWFDERHVGALLSNGKNVKGGVFSCPEDDDALRSYAMNAWVSSALDPDIVNAIPATGVLWGPSVERSTQVILLIEVWSGWDNASKGYSGNEVVGWFGDTPGQRFGAGGGLAPPMNCGRCGLVNSELAYARHRPPGSAGTGAQPVGVVNVAYMDGHVEAKSEGQLADFGAGKSRLESLWSPMDFEQNR